MRRLGLALLLLAAAAPARAAEPEPVDALALLQVGAVTAPVAMAQETMRDSGDAGERLTYASILFYQASHALVTGGEGEAMFRDVEQELTEAIRLSAADPEERRRNIVRAQAAFLLGELARHVRRDTAEAEQFYTQALRHAEHIAAARALQQLQAPPVLPAPSNP